MYDFTTSPPCPPVSTLNTAPHIDPNQAGRGKERLYVKINREGRAELLEPSVLAELFFDDWKGTVEFDVLAEFLYRHMVDEIHPHGIGFTHSYYQEVRDLIQLAYDSVNFINTTGELK